MYGRRNTFWRRDIEVHHALADLGPRYAVSYEDKQHLAAQVAAGRRAIGRYIAARHPELPSFESQLARRERRAVVPDE